MDQYKEFLRTLKESPFFEQLLEEAEDSLMKDIKNTKVSEYREREGLYHSLQGIRRVRYITKTVGGK